MVDAFTAYDFRKGRAMRAKPWFAVGVAVCLLVLGCAKPPASNSAANAAAAPQAEAPVRVEAAHLPNAYRLHEKVISGGQPDGEAAFVELERLGVKTVISVDGAKPDVELARAHGMRYVHLPHGYDGIPEARAKELAKAVRELPGPIYIHCHHGKHRCPAAATVACVETGFLAPEAAILVLKTAGTSVHYRGLYDSAANAKRLDDALLDELQVEFKETVELPAMAEAMVALEHTFDHVKQIAQADWQSPPKHPDIDPPHEALLLKEHFAELMRAEESQAFGAKFLEYLQASETASGELETLLLAKKNGEEVEPVKLAASLEVVTKNCAACHAAVRDVPFSEKAGR
jgi:protein tyrosine phosphatase (PTP) superfamily phosphohydrolase (DUF442 family)